MIKQMQQRKNGRSLPAPLIIVPDTTSKLALPIGSASPPVLWVSRRKTDLLPRSSNPGEISSTPLRTFSQLSPKLPKTASPTLQSSVQRKNRKRLKLHLFKVHQSLTNNNNNNNSAIYKNNNLNWTLEKDSDLVGRIPPPPPLPLPEFYYTVVSHPEKRPKTSSSSASSNGGVLGKVSDVAVTLKQWWRDVGLCPRAAAPSLGGPLIAGDTSIKRHHHHRCSHRRGSARSMGQSLSMCKLNHCRHKKSLHLRSSGDDCRMPAEGGAPCSESAAHRDRLQRHNHSGHGGHCYDPEYARMEAWLDEHPDFVQDYFLRKATRQVVDSWLVSHATPTSSSVELASPTHNPQSRAGSGATTPVRKISAHEFERGGLLKPMISTIDGQPTFLTSSTEVQVPGGANSPTPGRRQRRSRHELRHLDEKELIFELVKDICNELEVRSLCHKILQNVSTLLHADRGSLFLVQGERGGGCTPLPPGQSTTPRGRCLVSKLFDVCSKSTLMEMEKKEEIRIPWGTGIVGFVAESGEPVNIPDAYQDDRFNHDIDALTGYRTKTLLCMPIKDTNGDVIGVAQVINKLGDQPFTKVDEEVFSSYLQFCGIGLRNAHLYEKSQLEVKRNQVLLDLARMIFEEQSTIEHVVFRILTHTQSLIQCQRVQVLLVHQGSKISFSRVFDFEANDLSGEEGESRTSPFESRFPINVGITGYVATTGETANIPSAEDDERFDPSVDDGTGFKHKTILCMAIKNSTGQIIGVIQLINKFNDLLFTKNDENFVEAFAIFCGMGIHNTHMYEKAMVAIAKQSVTLEVLSYHATASMEDAQRLRSLRVPSSAHFRLHDFSFDDIRMDDDDTLTACIRMFLDLDLVERFHMDYEVLCRWLLSVKKNYRNVTYHNWRHAFNVAQMMFSILTATQWWNIFGEIECLALMIACLCHDLDHRGTNNSFQIKASSPLAQLYSTSTMEHHHFDQCIMILNSPGNQLLSNISSEEYSRVIRVLEEAILSTDLAVYFRKRGAFFNVVREGPCWSLDEHRELLRAMLMTVCDLAAITKPWEVEKRVAELVSSEFFEQGDIEREELNITPIDIMNREKEDQLPLMQVGFIDSICLPIYEAFSSLSDHLQPLIGGVQKNRDKWLEIAAAQSLIPTDQERDSNDNVSKPNTPDSNNTQPAAPQAATTTPPPITD